MTSGESPCASQSPPKPRFRRRILIGLCLIATAYAAVATENNQKPSENSDTKSVAETPKSPKPDAPRRHFRLRAPADLSGPQAEEIYKSLQETMAKGYGSSGISAAQKYQKWQRYNKAPFLSAAHGRRFVNHYANEKARNYAKFEDAGIMPVGAIIAKDNVTVKENGDVHPGALLLMEKMPKGFNYVSGDWRYTMVMPDGSLFGVTNGTGSKKVEFCIACHLAAEEYDHLHFPPKEHRAP